MKLNQIEHDADGKLKNGVFKEFFKDGTLACVGKYRNGEKAGEWKYYLRNGVLRPWASSPTAKRPANRNGTAKTAS
jgi:antitoxin component YwqK of YwqJK toxin-antitoxin module